MDENRDAFPKSADSDCYRQERVYSSDFFKAQKYFGID
jgi:hypothetical protein